MQKFCRSARWNLKERNGFYFLNYFIDFSCALGALCLCLRPFRIILLLRPRPTAKATRTTTIFGWITLFGSPSRFYSALIQEFRSAACWFFFFVHRVCWPPLSFGRPSRCECEEEKRHPRYTSLLALIIVRYRFSNFNSKTAQMQMYTFPLSPNQLALKTTCRWFGQSMCILRDQRILQAAPSSMVSRYKCTLWGGVSDV